MLACSSAPRPPMCRTRCMASSIGRISTPPNRFARLTEWTWSPSPPVFPPSGIHLVGPAMHSFAPATLLLPSLSSSGQTCSYIVGRRKRGPRPPMMRARRRRHGSRRIGHVGDRGGEYMSAITYPSLPLLLTGARESLRDVVCLDGMVYISSLRLHVFDDRMPFLHSPRPPPTS